MRHFAQVVRPRAGRALVACAAAMVFVATPAFGQAAGVASRDQSAGESAGATTLSTGLRGTIPSGSGRPIVRDGDLNYPPEPAEVQDGVLTAPAPEEAGAVDDPALMDQRSPEAIAAFENPPAGHDPLLFQIEDIAPSNPILNRRPRRLFEIEPYDPIGIRLGSFVLFPEVEISGARFSNVFASPNPESDWALDILPTGRLVSDWSNHALELRAAGDFSFYNEFTSENDRGYLIEGRGRLDVTRRTNVQAVLTRQHSKESRSAIDASSVGPASYVTQDLAASTLTHRFNRLTVQLNGTLTDTQYDAPGISNADDRNFTERAAGGRVSWEFKPTLSVFAAVDGNTRKFDHVATTDGLSRDSHGSRYRGGISFGETGQVLRGEISVGYGSQDFEAADLADVDGTILEANLAYRFNALTSFLFTAGTNFSETTTVGSGGVLEHRAGAEMRHAFMTSLIGSAGIEGTRRSYAGIDVDERQLALRLGLEYFMAREAIVFTRYEHVAFRSDFPDSNYDSDEFRIGLRLRR